MWNYGYISEVDYIHGYFSELSPARMKLALLSRGIAHSVGRSPSYLELGFGQGLTLNIHAATNSGHFYGTDFNPSQVANAAELAAAVGKQVTIWEDSFEDLAARGDLPQFDIVALHGIWSWVSDETRAAIQSIARHYLKPGGILYVSHNILPGWSPMMPLRHLLDEYSRRAATGGILSRVDQSLDFAEKLMSAGASYFKANPGVADRLKAMRKQDRSYVSHEYFNRHWNPETFASTSDALAECKLTYAASASLIDNIDSVAVPPRARPLLASISDDVLRETTRDYVLNQQFRRDLFIKGARRMTAAESAMQFDAMQFLAAGPLDEVPSRVATPMSAPASARATILQNGVAPNTELSVVIREWSELRSEFHRQAGLGLDAVPGPAPCLLAPSATALPYFDDLSQKLIWPIRDAQGAWLALTLDHEEPSSVAIEALEDQVRDNWNGLILARISRDRRGLVASPITLFGEGGPIDLTFWQKSRPKARPATGGWLARMRPRKLAQQFVRAPRDDTQSAIEAAWQHLIDCVEAGPSLSARLDGDRSAHAERLEGFGLPILAGLLRQIDCSSSLLKAAFGLLVARQQRSSIPLLV